ncbi:MAG: cation-translocating P-type ATPase [Candidatus Woesearchaeota archaeon]
MFDKKVAEVLKLLETSEQGLSSGEAAKRIVQYGKNELKEKKARSKFKIFLSQFNSFIVYILIAATVVSLALGEIVDGIAIFVILILNAVFGFVQEYKAEKAIGALKKLTSPKAKVIRDGSTRVIDTVDLVPGDIVVLDTGDKVSADLRIISCELLETNEASLTGESNPVRKTADVITGSPGIADQKNMLFAGTVVTQGRARAVVVGTAMQTEIGKIAGMLENIEDVQTPLQKRLQRLGVWLGYLTLGVCAIVFGAGLLRHEPVWPMFMASVALAVAVIPEGLPAVVTISLALGVQRMAKRNALVRNLPSVETLGATTVICTDKTGTLTRNEMTVTGLYANSKVIEVTGSGYDTKGEFFLGKRKVSPKEFELLLKIGCLNNDSEIQANDVIGDPTEASLLVSAAKAGLSREKLEKQCKRIGCVPFDSKTKRMVTIHLCSGKKIAYVKGAPDVILQKCSKVLIDGRKKTLAAKDRRIILGQNRDFASRALRVLGFAYKEFSGKFSESDLVFVGLQAMMDPPRQEVKDSIQKCGQANIRVVMITGDHAETAKAVAKEIGIEGEAVDGCQLDKIRDLSREVEKISIYARVNPEHKIRIVEALQKNGHIVAMTGDGVNDAPALKKAHIGIAMGIKGTDVAKESSAMILADDCFSSIVNAVEEGRGIDDNISKFVNYLLSCNFGELLVLFLAMVIGFRDASGVVVIPLLAVQILFINLVTDGFPALALGVDPINPKVMSRKPADPRNGIITKSLAVNIIAIGFLIAAATLFVFRIGLPDGAAKAQTLAFTTLVFLEIARVQVIRSQFHTRIFSNKWLILAVSASLLMQLAVLYTPLSKIFGTVRLGLADFLLIIGTTAAVYVLGIIIMRVISRFVKERSSL